jgi:ABC-type uncharacterized transport system permease subunit
MILAVIGPWFGGVLYHMVVYWALKIPGLQSTDMKVISAIIVTIALVVSQSTTVRGFFAKISPMRRHGLPEPMTTVPAEEDA